MENKLIFGAFGTTYRMYPNRTCAELAKYLYSLMDIHVRLVDSHPSITLSLNEFTFVTNLIGTKYNSATNHDGVVIALVEDVFNVIDAYNVIKMWKGHEPAGDVVSYNMPFDDVSHDSCYLFWNRDLQKILVVDGESSDFRLMVYSAGLFPTDDWVFLYKISKLVASPFIVKCAFQKRYMESADDFQTLLDAFNLLHASNTY